MTLNQDNEERDACYVLRSDSSEVSVVPGRGAIVSRVAVGGVEILYLDETTLDSPSGAVRGGIPLLFPFAGELKDGRLVASNTEMPRHGFGRRKPWQVTSRRGDAVTMRLVPDDETRAQYPFDFEATQVVTATARGVRIDFHVENHGAEPLPIAPGWHPYFPCPADQKFACLRQVLSPEEISPVEPVTCDVNIPSPPSGRVDFRLPAIGTISLTFGDALRTLEVWTPPGQPFLCVEPWSGASNVINTPEGVAIGPGGGMLFWMAIDLIA